jgi:hypothetical protein
MADQKLVDVTVTGPRQGRWRAGQHWGPAPRAAQVTEAQLAALKSDSTLKVQVPDDKASGKAAGPAGAPAAAAKQKRSAPATAPAPAPVPAKAE